MITMNMRLLKLISPNLIFDSTNELSNISYTMEPILPLGHTSMIIIIFIISFYKN